MNYESDIFIKDEGENMMTVCYQTPRAIKTLNKPNVHVLEKTYGSDEYKKWDIDASFSNYCSIRKFAVENELTFDSDVDISFLSTVII